MTITRKIERRRAIRNAGIVALGISVLSHLLMIAIFVPPWLEKLAEEPVAPPPRELEIEAVYAPEPPEPPVKHAAAPPAPTVAPSPPRPVPPVKLKAEIEDAVPQQAPAIASVEPPPSPAPAEVAPPEPVEAGLPAPLEEQSPVIVKRPPPARSLFMPSMAAYDEVFADADVTAKERARDLSKGKRLFRNYERTSQGIKDSLTSFGHDVKPGNHTGVDPQSNAYGSYVGMIHHKIHARWANGYLMDLDVHEPSGSPMNDPTLNTLLEFVIRADDGELESVNIVRSSGQLRFDAQALSIAHSIGPHPNAPPELVSPNGRVYVHWNFWRDQRQCGVFGANVFIVAEQGGSPG